MRWAVPSSTAGSGALAGVATLCTGAAGLAGASVVVGAFGRACGCALGWGWAQPGADINMTATSVAGTTRTNMRAPQKIAVSPQAGADLSLRIAPTTAGRSCRVCRESAQNRPRPRTRHAARALSLVGAGQDKVHRTTN